mgnify:CR=1 FL=1
MKLWQKVFCISLACVILAAGGTTLLVLLNNFRSSIRQETERRLSEHSFVVSTITNNVLYERIRSNVPLLSPGKAESHIVSLTAEPLIVDGKTLVLTENGNISSDSFEPLSNCAEYTDALRESDNEVLTYMLNDGGMHYLLTGSRNYIENEPYIIITVADLSSIFDSHYAELRRAAIVSFGAAVAAAVIIAFLIYRLLPLKRVNHMLKKIAGGSYDLKLPEHGGYEFRELARNINVMSDSINENVNALKAIADGRKQFVDNFAHEMKTPLTSILGFSDIMRVKKTMTEKERTEYAGIILEETKRLKNLSAKLLELSTTENAPLEFEDVYIPDLFADILKKISELSGKEYGSDEMTTRAFRIIADHMRTATFIMGDDRGVSPSNVDQGYVLRRLIRRAVRYGMGIGMPEGFTGEVAKVIIEQYKDVYPELKRNEAFVLEQLSLEESRFARTLKQGNREFEKLVEKVQDGQIDGVSAFHLYDTYGFPVEMTEELARERGLTVDMDGFHDCFRRHQATSQAGAEQRFKGGLADHSEQSARLHTATHLLHAALRKVLGPEVAQKGSNITAERLRFDFSFGRKMTKEELAEVERLVNEAIESHTPVTCEEMTVAQAKEQGAIGLFTSKYGENVKVYTMGPYSKEICGGPHATNTGDLKSFKIQKEESSSAGVRRIKAVIGTTAEDETPIL